MIRNEPTPLSQCVCKQSATTVLSKTWIELLDWGVVAVNSASRFLTALFHVATLAVAVVLAALAVIVLFLREQITDPTASTAVSLFRIDLFSRRSVASHSDSAPTAA